MDIMNYKFSVVATTYNDSKEILNFLNNIMDQSVKPFEIVISDGGSKDNTIELITSYAKKCPVSVKVLSDGRMNISQGINNSIKNANTELLLICAVGNIYPNDFFENMILAYDREKKADIICATVDGLVTNTFSELYNGVLMQKNSISGNHGMLVRKKVFDKIGYFYENFYFAGEDEEFLQRVANNNMRIYAISNCNVHWCIPSNWEEFALQIKRYVIATLQIYDNKIWFKFYSRKIAYACAIILAILLCVLNGTRIIGITAVSLLLLANIFFAIKKGFGKCVFKNFDFIYTSFTIFTNCKYFKATNKIDSKYLLKSRVNIGNQTIFIEV